MPTLPQLFAETVAAHPDRIALRWKVGRRVRGVDLDRLRGPGRAARGRAARPRRRARRPGRARCCATGPSSTSPTRRSLLLGATPVSIYNSSAPEQVRVPRRPLRRRRVAIVEDIGFLERFLKVRSELPALRHVAIIDDPDALAPADVHRWDAMLGAAPLRLDAELGNARPDDLAHGHLHVGHDRTAEGRDARPREHGLDDDVVPSKRPASTRRDGASCRTCRWRTSPSAPSRTTSGSCSGVRGHDVPRPGLARAVPRADPPQFFFAVPRVWEKAHAALRAAVARRSGEGRAVRAGARGRLAGVGSAGARRSAARRVRGAVGADRARARRRPRARSASTRCEIAMTGAAPIPFEILQFFRSLGVPLSEVYGLSETSGPMTWTPFRVKVGTVGPPMPGCRGGARRDGEVLTRGGNVFRGYLNAPEQDRRGVRRRRLVPHRRHRRARRRRLPQDRRPQEGAHHHRGRQEHLAGQPRSRAQGRAR